jgi:murein DD-endopeptidase MepM/ murein hydrolase activator NlpD
LAHLPVASPVSDVDLSSGYGYRHDPFTGQGSMHEGTDFRGAYGSPIYATAAGVVASAGYQPEYGYTVDIDHGFGLMTRYAHLEKILVKPGETVSLHQKLGLMGATGRATGVHLHYETRVNGNARNPLNFLKADHYVPEKIPGPSVQSDAVGHDRD